GSPAGGWVARPRSRGWARDRSRPARDRRAGDTGRRGRTRKSCHPGETGCRRRRDALADAPPYGDSFGVTLDAPQGEQHGLEGEDPVGVAFDVLDGSTDRLELVKHAPDRPAGGGAPEGVRSGGGPPRSVH